ncbi:mobile mystery protein B [Owenweeksia hongkongensis]|uniref:mobile mystery protein B n=1 Tax=Owenweeksia hongkongensis TaxID=253245 RepID=UPI003A8FAB81
MGLNLDYSDGQTPLDEEEKEGLLIPSISTKGELDEFEQQNIEEAIQWILGRSLKADTILTERFVKSLHKRMYGEIWKWAGQFRKSDKNLGIDKWQIPVALKTLLEDALFWVKNETYEADEIAIRFKHRIVSIHCFSNGNGRHSRLIADIIAEKIYKRPVFSWGVINLSKESQIREIYLNAVKEADKGNYQLLIDFARS